MKNTVSNLIIEGSRSIVEDFHSHPFVKGIANGELPIEKFQFYMIQDYLYLLDYAKVFSIGAAKASDPSLMRVFSDYVSSILSGEMDVHKGYMKKLGIDLKDAENAIMSQDNLSYTSYMLRMAYEGGPAEVCAAILPCAISYEEIARKMVENDPACVDHEFYGAWIKSYAGEEYHNENIEVMELTDKAAEGYSQKQIDRLIEIGRRCTLYEGRFWDMAWEMRK